MTRQQKWNLARIIVSAALLIPAMLLKPTGILKLAAFIIPYALCGFDVLWSAARNIVKGEVFDEKFLMTVATAGAFALGKFAEAVAVMLFYQIGEWFQDAAVDKSRRDIAKLMDVRPDAATVIRSGEEVTVPPDNVRIGEVIIVRPGEKIPLDGVIIEGGTSVNAAALTGESMPVDKGVGERVLSGSINMTGVIHVRTDSEFGESTVSRILKLVENASEKKARVENFITRFSKYYTPCVVGAALLLAVLPPLILNQAFSGWINRALIFLVVSCPCALVVSVPLSFFGGIGGASRIGILIKGANYLETLSKVKTAVFDKTGTLTVGTFAVTAVHPERVSEAELMDIAAVAESNSSHPIALSIVEAHKGHIDKSRISSVKERPGSGIEAVIDGRTIFIGNAKLMESAGASWRPCEHTGTIIHISEGSDYLGHIVVSDVIKPDAKEAIAQLKALGVTKTVMLTGDIKAVGDMVGAELGVDRVLSELLPADKVSAVESLLSERAPTMFIGDGVNDAPVLARADVGIAMGALGSDAAIEAADVVLMDDRLIKLPRALLIARKTMRIARQNIAFALAVKAIVLALGALGLTGMWAAVFADVGVMVLAILNAMRGLYVSSHGKIS